MTAPLDPTFPNTLEDYAEVGRALLRLYVARGALGHEVMASTCIDYIPREPMDHEAARLVWDIAVASSPFKKHPAVPDARERLQEWIMGGRRDLELAEHVADQMLISDL